jgi:hypothetical protein
MVNFVLKHHFAHPDSDDGCPDCCPELLEQAEIDRVDWLAAQQRARGVGST